MEVQYLQIVHTLEVPLKKVEVFKKFPNSLKVPLIAAPKVVEGNQLSVYWIL